MFASKGICHSIANFLCDEEAVRMAQVSKLAHVGFSQCPLFLERIRVASSPPSVRNRIQSSLLPETKLMVGLTRPTNLIVLARLLGEQLCEISVDSISTLRKLSIFRGMARAQDTITLSDRAMELVKRCSGLEELSIGGFVDGFQLMSGLFESECKLKALELSRRAFKKGASSSVGIRSENLVSLCIKGSFHFDWVGFDCKLMHLEHLEIDQAPCGGNESFVSLLGSGKQLKSLVLLACFEMVELLGELELELDNLTIGCDSMPDAPPLVDLPRWKVSKSLNLHGFPASIALSFITREGCCCLPTLQNLGIWTEEDDDAKAHMDVDLDKFSSLECVSSDSNSIFALFSEIESITHVGVLDMDQATSADLSGRLPVNAKHLLIKFDFSDRASSKTSSGRWKSIRVDPW